MDGLKRWERPETSIFFTPRGEALTFPWYREAVIALSWMKPVKKVAVQTNLSMDLQWLGDAAADRVALWCTFHPAHVSRERFIEKCRRLRSLRIAYSVGMVGLKEHLHDMETLRGQLDDDIYLWVNAYKKETPYYTEEDVARIRAVDPLFDYNQKVYASRGKRCRCGETVFSVDGRGDLRPCLFTDKILGNMHESDMEDLLNPTAACENDTCRCHIGYVHMYDLGLYDIFGDGVLARIPKSFWQIDYNKHLNP
jgi:hypothetical protein